MKSNLPKQSSTQRSNRCPTVLRSTLVQTDSQSQGSVYKAVVSVMENGMEFERKLPKGGTVRPRLNLGKYLNVFRHRYGLMKRSWSYQTNEFFENSTLHGIRYIAEEGRPFYEKFLWFCSVSVGTVAALIIIVSLWEKFQTNPTITGLDTDFHNWDVPFPAVTLCQTDPSNESLIENYISNTWPDAPEDKKSYYTGFLRALANLSYTSLGDVADFAGDPKLPHKDLREMALGVLNRCHVLTECDWKGEEFPGGCCPLFRPVFTENGFCYTFNSRFSENNIPWDTFIKPFKQEFIQETDPKWSIAVDAENPANNSIRVYITSSDDLPGVETSPQHVWTRRISKVSFASKETYTTEDARQLTIRQRRCIFADEVSLLTDYKYTYTACMRQCRMERARKLCGCVPHFYPEIRGFRYCDLDGIACLHKKEKQLQTKDRCPCELGCMNTVYEMEKLHEASPESQEEEPLEIAFVSWPMVRYKREVLFGWVDLLVAFGGIAGLFLGFSLLSGVEVIYYFTLRAWCMVYRDRDHLEELQEEYDKKQKQTVDLSLRPAFMRNPNVAPSPETGKRHVLSTAWADEEIHDTILRAGGLGLVGADGGRIHPLGGNQRRRLSSQYHSLQHPQANQAWGNTYLP